MAENITKRGLLALVAVLLAGNGLDAIAPVLKAFVASGEVNVGGLIFSFLVLLASVIFAISAWKRKERFFH